MSETFTGIPTPDGWVLADGTTQPVHTPISLYQQASSDWMSAWLRERDENKRLRQELDRLNTKAVDAFVRTEQFMAQLYRLMAQQIAGEWKAIGESCGWTPEQIALAEVLANATRQELFARARQFDDEVSK